MTVLAWSRDGSYLASGDAEGMISLWEAQTGFLLACARAHQDAVVQLLWSPVGYQLTSAARHDPLPRVWEYAPPKIGAGKEASSQ